MKKLSPENRHASFVEEYLKDFNATRAAIAVGYSARSASVQGARLLANDKVKLLISNLTAITVAKTGDEREEIRKLLTDAANLDLTDLILMGKTGASLKEFKEIPKHLRILITEITNVSGKTGWKINFKVFSKEKAVEMLARIYGLDKGNSGLVINNYGDLSAIVGHYPD